jgi:hypothetical protein
VNAILRGFHRPTPSNALSGAAIAKAGHQNAGIIQKLEDGMKVDACVVDESVLIYRKDEPQDLFCGTEPETDPSAVQVSPDDPRLTETVVEDNPEADAFEPSETLAIH